VKLLVSCANETEAAAAARGGADIIDAKNPKEGALGASFPWIVRNIKAIAGNIEVSCTLGDLPNLPGSVSFAALGAATTGAQYVKVGLGGVRTRDDAMCLLRGAVKAAKDFNPAVKIVAAGYADAERTGSLDPMIVPEIADNANADVAMVDTGFKNGDNLFSFLTKLEIREIVADAHQRGLKVALAGSLRKEHLPDVFGLDADIVGVRGAACTNKDRINGQVTLEAVRELADILKRLHSDCSYSLR
jgi:(5-formylfuran-3-yl)methyl phosphate synthase